MKKLSLSILYILCSLFIFSTPAQAKVMIQEKGTIVIPTKDIIEDDLFVGSENLEILGTVSGTVFAGAGNIETKGLIKGDLVLGTGKANLSGIVMGDLYIGAGDVTITKMTIGGNVTVAGGNVNIDSTSKIGGSLIVASGNLKNYASVGRSIMAGGDKIYLDSQVGKEVRVGGSSIELGPNSEILGNLTYALSEDLTTLSQDPSSTVAGTVSRYTPPSDARREMVSAKEDFAKFGQMAHRSWLAISFLGSLLLGIVLLRLFPKTILGFSQNVERTPTLSLGIGLLIIIFAVPVMLVLALSVIGLPIVGLLIPLFMISLTLAKLVSSYALGRFATRQFNWNNMGVYATYFVGLAVFYLLRAVPGIGWITCMLFTWVGLGSIWLYIRSHQKSL